MVLVALFRGIGGFVRNSGDINVSRKVTLPLYSTPLVTVYNLSIMVVRKVSVDWSPGWGLTLIETLPRWWTPACLMWLGRDYLADFCHGFPALCPVYSIVLDSRYTCYWYRIC